MPVLRGKASPSTHAMCIISTVTAITFLLRNRCHRAMALSVGAGVVIGVLLSAAYSALPKPAAEGPLPGLDGGHVALGDIAVFEAFKSTRATKEDHCFSWMCVAL